MALRAAAALAALALAPGAALARAEREAIVVKGSDTIGGELGPSLARAYSAATPGISVAWEGLGSATAFQGLLDGSAEVGASSRSVNAKELADAKELGVELKEWVLGYDGVAVIANPANGVSRLTLDRLSAVFAGELGSWRELGGADLPIRLVSRPSYSGTHAFFKEKVLRRGRRDGKEDFPATTRFIEHSEDLVRLVARTPGAVGYVGMGYVRPGVTAIAVAPRDGEAFVLPAPETVRTGAYPVYRPLLLYTRREPSAVVRRFLGWILAGDGRTLIASYGFTPADAPEVVAPDGPTRRAPGPPARGPARRVTYRVLFPDGGASIGPDAERTLAAVAAKARARRARVRLVGNADARGSAAANERVARARAEAVGDRLVSLGVARSALVVLVRGADAPLATNDTPEGRRRNRRVDVELLAGP